VAYYHDIFRAGISTADCYRRLVFRRSILDKSLVDNSPHLEIFKYSVVQYILRNHVPVVTIINTCVPSFEHFEMQSTLIRYVAGTRVIAIVIH